jgi:hypothetical protein
MNKPTEDQLGALKLQEPTKSKSRNHAKPIASAQSKAATGPLVVFHAGDASEHKDQQ